MPGRARKGEDDFRQPRAGECIDRDVAENADAARASLAPPVDNKELALPFLMFGAHELKDGALGIITAEAVEIEARLGNERFGERAEVGEVRTDSERSDRAPIFLETVAIVGLNEGIELRHRLGVGITALFRFDAHARDGCALLLLTLGLRLAEGSYAAHGFAETHAIFVRMMRELVATRSRTGRRRLGALR